MLYVLRSNEKHSSTAQLLRDSVILRDIVGRFGCSYILYRDELNIIVHYLATACKADADAVGRSSVSGARSI